MDIETVMQIIKMIEIRICYMQEESWHSFEYDRGALDELSDLQHHLQSFIEAELNKAEQ